MKVSEQGIAGLQEMHLHIMGVGSICGESHVFKRGMSVSRRCGVCDEGKLILETVRQR